MQQEILADRRIYIAASTLARQLSATPFVQPDTGKCNRHVLTHRVHRNGAGESLDDRPRQPPKHAQFGDVFESMLPEVLDPDWLFRDGDTGELSSKYDKIIARRLCTPERPSIGERARFCSEGFSTAQRRP